ncbi:MAG: AbrB/MazE/SpoVT family DNA-binding domain-containing protein [Candidatus Omnitrophica bacterium]|nr:AbrB/MazE/SpoVT family DNA-binding domain-containing protein [Candidatus Omnitrophota bacterium]
MQKTIKRKRRISKKRLRAKGIAFRMAIISSRGQLTLPQDIRILMHIRKGSIVGFEPTRRGVLMRPMKVEPEDPYTEEEWDKIEKLSKSKGEIHKSAEEAKKHIADL